jgi:hypothetical protein
MAALFTRAIDGRVGVLLLLCLMLSACATTSGYEAVLQTWVGDSTDHLVSVWGVPQQVYMQDGGGKVMQYERSGQIVLPGQTTYQAQTTYTNGTVSAYGSNGNAINGSYDGTSTTYVPHTSAPTVIPTQCVTRFTADSSGRIYNWTWQGNSCRAVAPKVATVAKASPAPSPVYQKCTADQLRRGECS